MPTSKDLQHLLDRIQLRLDESFVGIGSEVADLLPEDLAELLNQLRILPKRRPSFRCCRSQRCIELCDQPTMRRRAAILEQLEPSRVAAILEGLSADERTDVIQKMGLHERHRMLPKFSADVRAELEDLLQYPDHTAGGIMTTEFVRLDPKMTVGDALKHIRSVAQ
jgi:magnesium transporter